MRRLAPAILLGLAACSGGPRVIPRVSAPPPVATIVPPKPAVTDWRDIAETPGGWTYVRDDLGSAAAFGLNGGAPDIVIRCDRAGRVVRLSRVGIAAGTMSIRTSYEERSFPAAAGADGRLSIRFAAADPFLDKIAFSRGRFSVANAGAAMLVLPAWAEPARVIEDCRS